MGDLTSLTTIDYSSLFFEVFTILMGLKAVMALMEWVTAKLGIEVKWTRKQREEHALLMKTSQNLNELQEKLNQYAAHSDHRDNEICRDIQKLTDMFLDKEIEDWRWKILDFSSGLSNGRLYNRESFDHIFRTYDTYEKVLRDNGLDNGLIEETIKFIRKKYQECMDRGTRH